MTGEDIRSFRECYGFSQYELAEAVDISRGYLATVEQGRRPVNPYTDAACTAFFANVRRWEQEGRI